MDENKITDTNFEDWFGADGIFMPMLNDTGRNVFYDKAIALAAPGKVVCDVGTGTGILSILAARAGAIKVYAVEQDQGRAEYAKEMFKRTRLDSIIEVVYDDFLNTNIPADIYVSETINTQIFGENILALANHARKHGGTFIPSQFEITAEVYKNHPIFPLCQARSDAFEFQPDIAVDPVYEETVSSSFRSAHSLENTLYRANVLNGLFTMLPRFDDLRLHKLYTSKTLIVDLNQPVDVDSLQITIPANDITYANDIYVVITWKARYQTVVMDVNDTWFGNSSKTILRRTRKPELNIKMWYDSSIQDWQFSF
jgi:predicted RNA methylase